MTAKGPQGKSYRKAFITVHKYQPISGSPKSEAEARKMVARGAKPGEASLVAVDAIRTVFATSEQNLYLRYERVSGKDTVSGKVPIPPRKAAWISLVGQHNSLRTHENVDEISKLIERALREAVVS